jgi:hypothetical protein
VVFNLAELIPLSMLWYFSMAKIVSDLFLYFKMDYKIFFKNFNLNKMKNSRNKISANEVKN